ncbi:MAG: DUF3078 domain-containing protein [Pseudarcicella sp.]|nr:DUF3078 domain-containing protein [Pseudarcicella sp.]MBP6411745.1 DUF3078 domain-containing protein [Pseudarcicella sp.]
MKIKIFTLSVLCAISLATQAQTKEAVSANADPSWKKSYSYGANFSAAKFSNWQAGGQNAIGSNIFGNYKIEKTKGKGTWTHEAQGQIGFLGTENDKKEFKVKKTIDRLFLDSKYSRKISDKWSWFGNLNFQSQFYEIENYDKSEAKGIQSLSSSIFSPAYITEALGVEWKPVSYFNMSISPGAFRQTIVLNNNVRKIYKAKSTGLDSTEAKTFGVEKGKSVYNEIALLQVVSSFDKDIVKNVNLKLRHTLFANYKRLAHIDNRLDAKITAKVNDYISTNLDFNFLYDDDQSLEIQTAFNFGIGLLIKK